MRSFVVFSCAGQSYGINLDCVRRILSAQPLTLMPDEADYIEGMFKYEDAVLKVVGFRNLLGQKSYTQELKEFFPDLKSQHKAWLDALIQSVEEGAPFTKTTDPHACHLGKWIDSFHPDNAEVVETMKNLIHHHDALHHSAVDVLKLRETCQEEAHQWIEDNVQGIYKNTLSHLEKISSLSSEVATDMQQCLVLMDKDNEIFGMNIDKVDDIVHVQDSDLHEAQETQSLGEFMEVKAILNHNGKLVTILDNMKVF